MIISLHVNCWVWQWKNFEIGQYLAKLYCLFLTRGYKYLQFAVKTDASVNCLVRTGCRRRRFRPASSVPSPRNCSPLSQPWAPAKNDDSSASNWRVMMLRWQLQTRSLLLARLNDVATLCFSIYFTFLAHSTCGLSTCGVDSQLAGLVPVNNSSFFCLCIWLNLL